MIVVEVSFKSNINGIPEELLDLGGIDASALQETPDMQPEVSEDRMKMPQKK